MFEDIKREMQTTISPLLAGILRDAQALFEQEVELAKSEVRHEVGKVKVSMYLSGSAAALALVSALLFAAALVHLLIFLVPSIPLWGGFAIVGAVCALVSAVLFMKSASVSKNIKLIPEQTIESIKENAQWIAKQIQ